MSCLWQVAMLSDSVGYKWHVIMCLSLSGRVLSVAIKYNDFSWRLVTTRPKSQIKSRLWMKYWVIKVLRCTLTFPYLFVPLTGPVRSLQTETPLVQRPTRVNITAHPSGVSNARTHRRAPQSSSGSRQPERALARAPPLERRGQHHTKPQSDQRNRNKAKLSKRTHILQL